MDGANRELDGGETIEQLLLAVSPLGSVLRHGSMGDHAPFGYTNISEMIAIRSRSMLLPNHRIAAAGVVLARARSINLSRRQQWLRLGASASVGLGVLAFERRRLFLDVPSGNAQEQLATIDGFLSEIVGEPVRVGISQPTKYRANRKALMVVVDTRGRAVAYCKVATIAFTKELLAREAATLTELSMQNFEHLTVPSLLWTGELGGLTLMLVGALRPRLLPIRTRDIGLVAAMSEFAHSARESPTKLIDSPWWNHTKSVVDASSGECGDLLRCVAGGIEARFGTEAFPLGRWHGDWTRWNMGYSRDQMLLWDFERSEVGVPVGFDAVHHVLSAKVDCDADPHVILKQISAVQKGEQRFADLSVPCEALVWSWLLTLAVRARRDADAVPSEWSLTRALRLARLVACVVPRAE